MGGSGLVGRSIASSLSLRRSVGLSVGKHVVPDKLDSLVLESQLPVNDDLAWDTGTPFPERCIDGIADKVGKYEAWLSGTRKSIFWRRKVVVKDVQSKAAYLCTAISGCARTLNWHLGLQIHAHVVRSGYEDYLFLSSALVDFYAKCGKIVNAWKVFCCMKRHDQVSWTSIISGFSHMGQGKKAIWMFKAMLDANIKPNCLTYVSVISACKGTEETFDQGTMLHSHVLKLGFNNNSFVVSSLINCYAKCGRADQAALLFDEATVRDTILFNSMITAYSLNLYSEEALKLFIRMRSESASPTDHTLTSVLNVCGSLTLLHQGRQVHSLVTKLCSEKSVFLISSLIDMYSKCGSIGDARFLFDQTLEKNDVVWTSMILGYAQSGRGAEALELFERFEILGGYKLDHICFTAVLTACNHAGFVDKGIEYFNKMRRDYGLVPQLDQFACMIDLYARNGHLREAKELMEEMPYEPNYVMWSSFLNSCNSYGEVELGREAAYQLFKMEPWNAASYIMLAKIYAKAGLWNEVVEVRKLMHQKGIRKSAGSSWVEVDKGLHLFSVGDAAHPESQKIYEELEKLNFEMKEAGYIQKHYMSQRI